jgi:hypothetical protein
MNTKLWILWIAAFAALGPFGAGAAHAVNAEPGDSDDRTLSKVARARAKMSSSGQSKPKSKDGKDQGGDSSCDLNIGNTTSAKPGNGPKEIIVVVQGDVINANNKCK